MSRARTLISGLVALAALLVALVGIPVALAALGGSPLPDHVPDLQEIWTAVSTPDASGSLFIGLMTIAGWIGWASFAVSTLVEGWAALTRVQVPSLPGPMRLTQGSSAVLVGAIVAAVAILGATSSTPRPRPAPCRRAPRRRPHRPATSLPTPLSPPPSPPRPRKHRTPRPAATSPSPRATPCGRSPRTNSVTGPATTSWSKPAKSVFSPTASG